MPAIMGDERGPGSGLDEMGMDEMGMSEGRRGEEVVNYRSARVARTMPAHVEEGQNNF